MIIKNKTEDESNHLTLEKLLDNSTDYPFLKIILSRNGHINNGIGKRYFMVTPSSFGVVKLLDLNFDGERVTLKLQDCISGVIKQVPLNINNRKFKFLLIYWDNIKNMVMEEILTNTNKDDMLEIEF